MLLNLLIMGFINLNIYLDKNTTDDFNFVIRFDISDSGCGINNQDYNKLFKSFTQLDNRSTTKFYPGTGLGLVISKELVELMHGKIWLEKSSDEGSTFSFIIPLNKGNDVIENENSNIDVLKNKNVLIIDDNLHNRISLSGIVTKWNMSPQVFSNAEEALYFTRIKEYDLGLIDICMPNINGLSFAKYLKLQNEFNNKTMPLIALSSLNDNKNSKIYNDISTIFNACLIKPYKESLLQKICINIFNNDVSDNDIKINNITNFKKNLKILLAEDIHINQKIICNFLNKLGFNEIDVVSNGKDCIELIYKNNYDIILLDIKMPIMTGEEVIAIIRQETLLRKSYIIAITAYCLIDDKKRFIDMGFDDYLPKPINLKDLDKCMNKFLNKLLKD